MIPSWMVVRIEHLLQMALSYRTIAKDTGVSRYTVQRIATGKRSNCAMKQIARSDGQTQRRPERCSICGAWVIPPCHACKTRAAIQALPTKPQALRRPIVDDTPLALMLRSEEQQRYEQIRRVHQHCEVVDVVSKSPKSFWPKKSS
jgi:hypothetical protein